VAYRFKTSSLKELKEEGGGMVETIKQLTRHTRRAEEVHKGSEPDSCAHVRCHAAGHLLCVLLSMHPENQPNNYFPL
jgi:hypothetical protein